jgi:ribonuclease HI
LSTKICYNYRIIYFKEHGMAENKTVYIYSDGACSGNPGPGGWGVILRCGGRERELSGGEKHTTNNRMELSGVINGLEMLKFPCDVIVQTDSKYVVDGIEKGWAKNWRAKNWIKSDKKPALNPDLWERLLELTAVHNVKFNWIKGHAGHPENERCDRLAVAVRDLMRK